MTLRLTCNTRLDDHHFPSFDLSGQNPKFFKLIIQETLQKGTLDIPQKFVINHGDCLSPCLLLKLRDGMEWKIEVGNDSNQAWLQKGWKEFSEYYSLKHGYLLVFNYQIKFNFLVFIFDTSLLEIDYPPNPNSIPNLQLTPTLEIQYAEAEISHVKSHNFKGKKSRALEAAETFSSSKPWFKVNLKSNLLLLNIPSEFMRVHVKGHWDTVTLKAEGVKCSWRAKLSVYKQDYGRLTTGWGAFAKDNRLKKRDVCVLELVRSKTFKI